MGIRQSASACAKDLETVTEWALAPAETLRQMLLPSSAYSFNSRARMPISLSPRPERFTTSMSRAANVGAMRMASATACALSSAGRMPFGPRQLHHRIERCGVIARNILRAAGVVQRRMLGPDRSVIQPRGNRVRERDLPVLILQHIRVGALQHSRRAALEARRMLAQRRCRARRPQRR